MKTITLTDEQHMVLKAVLDRELERWPHRVSLRELWHACAKTASAQETAPSSEEPSGSCGPQEL